MDFGILDGWSKSRCDAYRKALGAYIEERFDRGSRSPLYNNLRRSFTDEEFIVWMEGHSNPSHKLADAICFAFGLRQSELKSLKVLSGQMLVQVYSKKMKRPEYLPLTKVSLKLMQHYEEVKNYSPNYVRKVFCDHRNSMGDSFNFIYAHTKTGQPRYQFSHHSLRKTAANLLRSGTNDIWKAKMFLRHQGSEYGATAAYLHYDLEEMRDDLQKYVHPLLEICCPEFL